MRPRAIPEGIDLGNSDAGQIVRYREPGLIEPTEATARVLSAIEQAGGRPLLVGGCVRDAVLGDHNPKDIDIEVYGISNPNLLTEHLARVGKVDTVGASFGVIKVRSGDEDFDVSLPRRESKMGDGHRGFSVQVDPDADEVEASGRRDFTVNALMYDPRTGEIVDCWGGMADMDNGILRHTTSAFADDPLRVLRGAQFASRFGWELDDDTVALCQSLYGEYATLPVERVWTEWNKALAKGAHISNMLKQLERTGWIQHYPQIAVLRHTQQDERWHPEGSVWTHSGLSGDQGAAVADRHGLTGDDRFVVVAASMLHDTGKATHTQHHPQPDGSVHITAHGHDEAGVAPTKAFLNSIGCPREVQSRVVSIVAEHMCSTMNKGEPSRHAVRRLARRLGPAPMREWAMVVEADRTGRGSGPASAYDGSAERWVQLADEMGVDRTASKRLLTGDVLIADGWKPGPGFRDVLDASIEAQDNDEFSDAEGAHAWFKRNYSGPAA